MSAGTGRRKEHANLFQARQPANDKRKRINMPHSSNSSNFSSRWLSRLLPCDSCARWHRAMAWALLSSLALTLSLALAGCAGQPLQASQPQTDKQQMQALQTETFKWSTSVSNYSLDLEGGVSIHTLLSENWFKDAQGKIIWQFYGSEGMWGVGGVGIAGGPGGGKQVVPKTFRLSYYDYQEDKFYQLEAELDQRRIYELFKQTSLALSYRDREGVTPRYDELIFGIAPQGHIMLWAGEKEGGDQVELASYRASVRTDMTVARYNATNPTFKIRENRWDQINFNIKTPETLANLKKGLTGNPDYYMARQRVMYPWRYAMSGNAVLVEYSDRLGNTDNSTVWPYEFAAVQAQARLRGAPREVRLIFNDKTGQRRSVYLEFFTQYRVNLEPDLSAVWLTMDKMFPQRTLQTNSVPPAEEEMATLDIHVSDDLQTYTATLIKGDVRMPLAIAPNPQIYKLEPYSHFRGIESPPPHIVKLIKEGPKPDSPKASVP